MESFKKRIVERFVIIGSCMVQSEIRPRVAREQSQWWTSLSLVESLQRNRERSFTLMFIACHCIELFGKWFAKGFWIQINVVEIRAT